MIEEKDFSLDQVKMASLMSDISEACYCSTWNDGNEYIIWKALFSGNLYYGLGDIDKNVLAEVAKLAVITGVVDRVE